MKPGEKRPVRMGIVGCGRATTTLHLPALRFVAGADVVALADSDLTALEEAANRFGIRRRMRDYRELLEDRTIEALAICVPAPFHAEIALAALDAGKHLFIEKPLALTLEDCDRMIEKAAGSHLRVMLGFNTRWHRFAREARAICQQGILGPVDVVCSVLTSFHSDPPEWRKKRISGGGVLLEMAMHHFDLWRFVLDAEIEEISAYSRSGSWDDEAATVTAKLECGALASATLAERTSQNNSLEIYGRDGSLSVSFYRFDGLKTSTTSDIPGNFQSRIRGLKKLVVDLPGAVATFRHGGEWFQSYVEEWRHFVDRVRTGLDVDCGLEDGKRALAVALAAADSARAGKSITLCNRMKSRSLSDPC